MKNKIILTLLLLIMIMLPINIQAKEYKVRITFYSNGGKVSSGNIDIEKGVIFKKNTTKADVVYKSNQTINKLNSLDKSSTFTLKKNNKKQTKNKEWMATIKNTNKKVYFSNSSKYTPKKVLEKLKIDPSKYEKSGGTVDVYLEANFSNTISVSSMKLKTTNKTIKKGKTFKLTPVFTPSNATNKGVTWKSNNTKIATVSSDGTVKGIKGGKTTIVAKSKDGGKVAKCIVTVHDNSTTKVTGIKLNKSSVNIPMDTTATISATISPSNATNKTIMWKTSNDKIATVNNGKIKGVSKGSATITATTADGSKKAKVSVKVVNNKVKSIKLNKTKATLKIKDSIILSETITPSNATNRKVTWKSSNSKIATVDNKGKVKAIKKGNVTITATTKDGSKKAKCKIKVKNSGKNNKVMLFVGNNKTVTSGESSLAELTGKIASAAGYDVNVETVTLDGANLHTISTKKEDELKETKYDYLIMQEGTNTYLNSDMSLYNTGVKEVLVRTYKKDKGKTFIRATWGYDTTDQSTLNNSYNNTLKIANSIAAEVIYDGKAWDISKQRNKYNLFYDNEYQTKYGAYLSAATIYATVFKKSPVGIKFYGKLSKTEATALQKIAHEVVFGTISLSPKSTSVQAGKTKQIVATTKPEAEVVWKSSNEKIATVNKKGVVTGKKPGTVTITAKANNTSDTATVKVEKIDLLTQNDLKLYKGRYYDLKVFLQKNVSGVSWSSENKSIAEVNSKGIIHGKRNGTVNIVAKTEKGDEKIKVLVRTHTNNKSYSLSNCSLMDVKTSGTKVKVYNCLEDVELLNPSTKKRYQIQGLSIGNNYIYFSSPMNGAWLSKENGTLNKTDDATTKSKTTIYIVRVPKSSTTMQYMKVEYSGHGQGIDTGGQNASGQEILYLNLGSKFKNYTQEIKNKTLRGTMYRGVGITTFSGNTSSAQKKHPGTIISIDKTNKLHKKSSTAYINNNVFNETNYYKYLKKVAKNTDYRKNPEASVDSKNKRIAIRSGAKVLIYNISSFRSGKGKPIYQFSTEDSSAQGSELYGNNFYTITGMEDATIKKYNIKTGKRTSYTHINFKEFLKDNSYVEMEPEGLSIHNGTLYAGIVTRPCAKYEGKKCESKVRYNTIIKVKGL